jgi:sugar lactone lactonase YvrE
VPVARPSSCAFGGKDLDELYITTISEGLPLAKKKAQPTADDLFMVKTQVKVIAEPKFSG